MVICLKEAESSLRFYRNCRDTNACNQQNEAELKEELRKLSTIAKENADAPPVELADFCMFHKIFLEHFIYWN